MTTMKATPTKLSLNLPVIGVLLVSASSYAALPDWQNRVTSVGATPAATRFNTVSGSSPILVDVGSLTGDRSFEFIVNAGFGGGSSAFLGTRAVGSQGLKFEQWQDSAVYGLTVFGIVDLYSTTIPEANVDTHVVFVSDGATGTDLYVNGSLVHTFSGRPLEITGMQGLAGISEGGTTTFTDILDGNILGFASYDSALNAAEILDHYQYFRFGDIPERWLSFEEFPAGTRVRDIY